eukprot:m.42792 g.42792  ORF g.42792 m.42792 type:complete len:415 (+) comp6321_c0_seq1:3273-4517(+)
MQRQRHSRTTMGGAQTGLLLAPLRCVRVMSLLIMVCMPRPHAGHAHTSAVATTATTTTPSPPPWPCHGWPQFNRTVPPFWFGGPIPESPTAMRAISRYSAAFMSSQGNVSVQQCTDLKRISPTMVCLTYRQTAVAWPHDPPFSDAVVDPAHCGWWLQADNGSRWLAPSYFWDWRNTSLQQWYTSAAVSALMHEAPAVNGAFFDDFDGAVCPFESAYANLPSRYTASDRQDMHRAKMKVMGLVAQQLCRAGQRAIFAMAATFDPTLAPTQYRCNTTEGETLTALGFPLAPFLRYRIWPRTAQLTSVQCQGLIGEILREQTMGIDSLFYTIVEPTETLSNVSVAAFLLTRGPHSLFGASAGWVDADWQWHDQYNLDMGLPSEPATHHGDGEYSRRYSRGTVSLSCATLTATISPLS